MRRTDLFLPSWRASRLRTVTPVFRSLFKQGIDMDHGSKSRTKRSVLHEPLAFRYLGLILFLAVYFVRPEDWIPGLKGIPLAKITGILIFLAMVFPVLKIRWNLPQEIIFLSLLVAQL